MTWGIVGALCNSWPSLCYNTIFCSWLQELQGSSHVLSMVLLATVAFAWEFLWGDAHYCSISFGIGMPLSRWSHLGLFSGNTDFSGMLLYLGSPLYHGYCENIGFSSSMTLLCSYREIQKSNCSLRLTGRQASSSHLSWLGSFSCVSKKQDESY